MITLIQRAVDRNLHETIQALREHRALSEIEKYQARHAIYGLNYFTITYLALVNSMMGHVSKVLDRHKDSVGFWFIYKTQRDVMAQLKSFSDERIQHLRDLTKRVKLVRDKTLFHIDKDAVFDPREIWREAKIKGNQLKMGLDYLYDLLYELCDDGFKKSKFQVGVYNGDDISKLLEYARQNELCIFE